ncbi:exodeoxyribonuclease VII small subunit [Qipengyuania sp. SS22]|uniref:exodeoxyribonuclease VII small subunit n=1 Tax=Qipengyuania sp. SS22 TaxID=2979461 RepID=UPI0021E59330|nr:exodeoxyribonuclease VII small subunit [Qipengyuania sp. SS22]UYH55707.1 exodeoxyribonuclease VII small subunit [Qipengyuania sp. SS22]
MAEEQSQISDLSFEQALRELEGVVRRLESGDVPLDESIDLYERGEKLRKACQARLDAAQARIEKIVAGADGKPTGTEPFDAGGAA